MILKKAPIITVLMPVYNGEKYLREAIDSILCQTFKDFEFLIINDGSTDRSVEIIKTYEDLRINLVHNEKNLGLVATLNNGIDLAKGKYIARMDCDDISLPERLERQVSFMDKHQEISVCGTWVKTMGDVTSTWKYPVSNDEIRCRLLFESALAHPSAIIRKKTLLDNNLRYSIDYKHAEDYNLWVNLSKKNLLANIDKVLLEYRLHRNKVGAIHNQEQLDAADEIRIKQLNELGIRPLEEEFLLHHAISLWEFRTDKDFIRKAEAWLIRLKDKNMEKKVYPEPAFLQVLAERWFAVCNKATALGLWIWKEFWQSPLSMDADLRFRQKVSFAIRCGVSRKV
jgi:glycosyltransferase involved in cell wall biosynthesis